MPCLCLVSEEYEELSTKVPGSPPEPSQDSTVINGMEASPSVGDKRVLSSPGDVPVPLKRQR